MGSHISLTFGTTLGRTRTVRVNNPFLAATDAVVRSAMTDLINSHAIAGPSGRINSMRRASFIETQVTPIQLLSA